jgi:hypothetical protein
MNRDAEGGDRLARRSQPPAVGGGSDEHLGEVTTLISRRG